MINWKQKLSSRKFWSLLLALIGAVLVAFNVPSGSIESIVAIIGAFASIITYILAEAHIDGQSASTVIIESEKEEASE